MSLLIKERLFEGYTIYISMSNEKIRGSSIKKFDNGYRCYELPLDSVQFITKLDNVIKELKDGALIQIKNYGCLTKSVIGYKRAEGPYGENRYLDVKGEKDGYDYLESLIGLDNELNCDRKDKDVQYIKMRKGDCIYE